ncbi:MAG: hypothetical protein ACFCVK_04640 [Acidimicrobiales bacterium]
MTVRVDYRCRRCGHVVELEVATPPAATRCRSCGSTAKRQWSLFGVGRRDLRTAVEGAVEGAVAPSPGLGPGGGRSSEPCRTSPGVPGLCLLGDSAARALVARATNDGRSLEREQRRQTAHLSETGRHGTVVSDHGHSHGHGHGGANPASDNRSATRGPREIT